MEGSEKKTGKEEGKRSEYKRKQDLLVKLQESNALILLLIASFVLFLLTRHIVFAVASGTLLILTFFIDIAAGMGRHGIKKELIEVGIAVLIALIVWNGLVLVLNTSSPVSAIVSCSMLSSYERGDLIILQGARPDQISTQTVEMSAAEIVPLVGVKHPACGRIGQLEYLCGQCTRTTLADRSETTNQCSRSIKFDGTILNENLENDVVVYSVPQGGQRFPGDIIHRVFAKISADGKTFFITLGDNNDFFDTALFTLIPEENVKGKVILRIPYVGYLKLFISGFFDEPRGCESVLQH